MRKAKVSSGRLPISVELKGVSSFRLPQRKLLEKASAVARAYAARLGCIAMVFGLIQPIFYRTITGSDYDQILLSSIAYLVIFAVIGFLIGTVAEYCIRQSIEENFRRSLEKSKNKQLDGSAGDPA